MLSFVEWQSGSIRDRPHHDRAAEGEVWGIAFSRAAFNSSGWSSVNCVLSLITSRDGLCGQAWRNLASLFRDDEPWKNENVGPIRNTTNLKFGEIFSPKGQEYILCQLDQY